MSKTLTVDAQLARNRRVTWICSLPLVVSVVLGCLISGSVERTGLIAWWASYLGGFCAAFYVVRPVWLLIAARFLGVRPRAVVVGAGRFVSSRGGADGIVRVRRATPLGWWVVAVPEAGTGRWRLWTAYAIPAVLEIGLAVAVWHWLPGSWATASAIGVVTVVLAMHTVVPGVSPTAGWVLFRLPAADVRALDLVTVDTVEDRALRAAWIGDAAAWRAALAEASPTRPNTAALLCELAFAEGRYADAAALAAEHGPHQPQGSVARAVLAQHLVRAQCYAHEERTPRSFVAAEEIETAMSTGLSSVAAVKSTDAQALYWIARNDTKRAAHAAAQARATASGPHAAAHVECTVAVVETLRLRPAQAARALATARTLAPDLPRIAAVERWCTAANAPLGAHAVSEPALLETGDSRHPGTGR